MAKKSITTIKYEISEELEEIVGNGPMTRPMVVKKLWEYIKANDCQEGRIIHPDDLLSEVLGKKSLDMFAMQKKLSAHIFKAE